MRPSTLSRKLDLVVAIGQNQFHKWHNGAVVDLVNGIKSADWRSDLALVFLRVEVLFRLSGNDQSGAPVF
jgi:hypothetical protein